MRLLSASWTLAVAAVVAGSHTVFAAPAPPHGDWYVGVAYGTARGTIDASRGVDTVTLAGVSQFFRVGRALHPRLGIGYEHQAWLYEQGVRELKTRAGVQLEALGVTVHPVAAGTAWSGLHAGVGAGWARARLTLLEPLAPGESAIGDTYETVFKQDEFGWGWYASLGYDYPITRSFAAGVTVGYDAVEIGGDIFDRAHFVPVIAGLDWSF